MTNQNKCSYEVNIAGPWRLYTIICPPGWRMMGTIEREWELPGALGLSPVGLYAQINAGVIRSLNQRAVTTALQSKEQTP